MCFCYGVFQSAFAFVLNLTRTSHTFFLIIFIKKLNDSLTKCTVYKASLHYEAHVFQPSTLLLFCTASPNFFFINVLYMTKSCWRCRPKLKFLSSCNNWFSYKDHIRNHNCNVFQAKDTLIFTYIQISCDGCVKKEQICIVNIFAWNWNIHYHLSRKTFNPCKCTLISF